MTTAVQRTVLVLGRAAEEVQVHPDDVAGSLSLVVVVVGWPITASQQAAVDTCRTLARDARVVFDAILVGSFDCGIAEISESDRVLLGTDRRETRRVQRTLAARKISARVAR